MAAGLLASALRYLLPVGDPARCPFVVEFDHAEAGLYRVQGAHAELSRFLDHQIHHIAFDQCLNENQLEIWFRKWFDVCRKRKRRAPARQIVDGGQSFFTLTVEYNNSVSLLEPQHVAEIMCIAIRYVNDAASEAIID